jgi:iron complex outermembrane receptor protein
VEVEPPKGIESIEVSGERMDMTNVQDTAQAVTAFGMADLDKLHIVNVDGLATNVPSLHVGQQGQAAIITLRGVGTENASLTGEAGVAFHVDDINYARPAAARVAFYDLEFLEVKRGPQGLLGGKNSTSGAIYVNTKDPTSEYEVQGDVLVGDYDRLRIRGAVNVPVGEFLAARIAVFSEQRDGYLDRVPVSDSEDPFDADNFGLRGKLRFTPSDSLDLVVGYNYFKEGGAGPQADPVPHAVPWKPCADPSKPFLPPISTVGAQYETVMSQFVACQTTFIPARTVPTPFGPVTIPAQTLFTPGKEDADPRKIYSNTASEQDDTYWGYSSKLNWEVPEVPLLGATQLKLVGGIQRTETEFATDFDGSSVNLFNLNTEDEVREYSGQAFWSGAAFQEKLEWQTSLFWMKESGSSVVITPTFASGDATSGQVSTTKSRPLRSDQSVENQSLGLAVYGSYHLTDSVTFSLGKRWIRDKKESFLHRRTPPTTANGVELDTEACIGGNFGGTRDPSDPTRTIITIPTCDVTYRGQMWGTRLEFRPTDDHLLYAGFDKGYKSGGFALGGVGGYKPEQDWAYTVGSKSEFFDQRLVVNLEGFWYDYKDMQLALIDGTEVRTENSDARMYGVELELTASPIEGLQLRALGNFIHTETIDYFTLDTAANDDFYQETRLAQRADAERLGKSFPSDVAEPGNCHPQGEPQVFVHCASLGDQNGLDDYSGNELSRSPKWKYMLSGEYEIPLGRLGSLTPGVKYSWTDDTYYRVFNRDFDLQEAYHTTDVKVTWNSPERRWTAEAFVDNIENNATKDYILIGSRLFGAPPLAWYGQPRFWGFSVGFKY